jgi:CRP-like cAMP-binding protein
MHSSEAFRQLMLKFSAALLAEAMQLSACHSLHASEARLACFLLLLQDRSSGALNLPLTQEILASMLSVQRTTITAVAGSMQKAGLISYRRGRLEILDHDGLAAVACECYGVIRAQYGRFLLHGRPPSA